MGRRKLVYPNLTPGFEIPSGIDREVFRYGAAVDLSFSLQPEGRSPVFFSTDLGYGYIFTEIKELTASRISLGAGPGLNLPLFGNLSFLAQTRFGYYFGYLNDGSAAVVFNPFTSAGCGLAYRLTRRLGVELNASYRSFLDFQNMWNISLGTSFRFGSVTASPAETVPAKEAAPLSVRASPKVEIPAGTDAELYKLGGSLELSGLIRPAALPFSYLSGDIGYGLIFSEAGFSVSRLSVGTGLGLSLDLSRKLGLNGFTKGGYYFAFLNNGSGFGGGGPYLSYGAGLSYQLNPNLGLGLEGSYNIYCNLANSWGVSLGTTYSFSPATAGSERAGGDLPRRAGPLSYSSATARAPSFTLRATPTVELPIGADINLFRLGAGMELSGVIRRPDIPGPYLIGGLGYCFLWVNTQIGYYYAFLNDNSGMGGSDAFISSGIELAYLLTPAVSLGVKASYNNYLNLYNNLAAALGTTFRLSAGVAPVTEKDIRLDGIFPALLAYYNDHPIGRITLHNREKAPMENLRLSIFIERYMNKPRVSETPARIEPGEYAEVDLYGRFSGKLLEVAGGSRAPALITLEYTSNGRPQKIELKETVRVHGPNSVTWDDQRKACAFITAEDPTVRKFTGDVERMLGKERNLAVNRNLRAALAMYEALCLYGMKLAAGRTAPYAGFPRDPDAIDSLQFPSQTLESKTGDRDDLAVLYSALLEAVEVETALVALPDCIFPAFSLDMAPETAVKLFERPQDLIFEENKSWVPVDVTELEGGFLQAWQAGAELWRNRQKDRTAFYPVHRAWRVYSPAGYPGEEAALSPPPVEEVAGAFRKELERFIDSETFRKIFRLKVQIRKYGDHPRYFNRLAVLYARYGQYKRAEKELERLLAREEYAPALVNLGNIYYWKKICSGPWPATNGRRRKRRRKPNCCWPWPGFIMSWATSRLLNSHTIN
ncbi:hypothetical protein ES703_13177 [subsurface metagenome]